MVKKVCAGFLVAFICTSVSWGQMEKTKWVDSVMSSMDVSNKIGQLMMIPVNPYEEDEVHRIENLIRSYNIGGVVITNGSPTTVLTGIQTLQQEIKVPLLVGINADQGLGSTLDSAVLMPPTLMMGAVENDSLLFYEGKEIGRQLSLLGIHINFGPNVDLSRSFEDETLILNSYGNNKVTVANKATSFVNGLQSSGILSVVKFYSNNSIKIGGFKKGQAQINMQQDADKLYPLQQLFNINVPGVLCANRQEPIFIGKRKRIISNRKKKISLSVPSLYTADYFKKQMAYKGLVFSYIPDVQPALNKKFKNGDSELEAFIAGNDILLFPKNIGAGVRKIKRALRKNDALQKQLDASVRKIITAKYDVLHKTAPNTNVISELNSMTSQLLQLEAYEKGIPIVKDQQQLLPITNLDNQSFASLSIGVPVENTFTKYLNKYAPFKHYEWQLAEDSVSILQNIKPHDVTIVGIFPMASSFENAYKNILDKLAQKTKLIIVNFGPPSKLSVIDNQQTIVQAFLDDALIQKIVPQLLFGALPVTASLPLTINEHIQENASIKTTAIGRLGYSVPEATGIDGMKLDRISDIIREAIEQKATPGCQVIVARKGKVVYERSFGWQTYDNQIPINDETIYDLASVTKVAATLQGVMFLYEHGLIDLYKKASYYIKDLRGTNKNDVTIKDILTHQAGLWPFVPFWMQTVKDTTLLPQYYSKSKSDRYPFQVAPHLFATSTMRDSIWTWIVNSKMREKPPRTPYDYTYSDIGLYLMHRLNETLFNQAQEDFLLQNLYEPLGASTMGYLPLNRFDQSRIAPTEMDKIFRRELLIGTVHDEGAAMNGGTAGHAGLFSNASDLTKLGQMLLQKGYYGGHQFYKPETVELFTSRQFETSRRGLGWDKPVLSDWNTPTSVYASPKTFGHTGFTGTCIWVDPEFDLVFVFLSNRVYPTRNVNKLSSLNIRSRIQDLIYQSIFSYCQYQNLNTWTKSK